MYRVKLVWFFPSRPIWFSAVLPCVPQAVSGRFSACFFLLHRSYQAVYQNVINSAVSHVFSRSFIYTYLTAVQSRHTLPDKLLYFF